MTAAAAFQPPPEPANPAAEKPDPYHIIVVCPGITLCQYDDGITTLHRNTPCFPDYLMLADETITRMREKPAAPYAYFHGHMFIVRELFDGAGVDSAVYDMAQRDPQARFHRVA